MNIALIGYGKMGRAIEAMAAEQGHTTVLRIHSQNRESFTRENLQAADVAIEFTNPEAAPANVLQCLEWGVPVVSGSTGWSGELPQAEKIAIEHHTALLVASNFSIGVNIFFEINTLLARLMNNQPDYEATIHEIHHTQKKDAPSGTAISLAEQILQEVARKKSWSLPGYEPIQKDQLLITSERTDPAPGTHRITWHSDIDDIELVHTAHNRQGFARGAVMAAAFIAGKKGIFTMKDVLGL
jgi:4-hydroxy-tetrahydrodipicolinate reductase